MPAAATGAVVSAGCAVALREEWAAADQRTLPLTEWCRGRR
jgi:hypothetical protein